MEKIREKLTSKFESIRDNYTDEFLESLVKLKVALLVLFIMITVVYFVEENQLIVNGNVHVYTMTHDEKMFKKLLLVSICEGLFGALAFIFVIGNRGGLKNLPQNIKMHFDEILLVAVILFFFRFSQETSGFNRWLSPEADMYKELDDQQIHDTIDSQFSIKKNEVITKAEMERREEMIEKTYITDIAVLDKIREEYEDPFLNAFGKTTLGMLGLFIFYHTLKMIYLAIHGYLDGKNSIDSYKIDNQQFGFEILMMFIISAIPSLLEIYIFGEKLGAKNAVLALGMGTTSASLHIMFQFTGLYDHLGKGV